MTPSKLVAKDGFGKVVWIFAVISVLSACEQKHAESMTQQIKPLAVKKVEIKPSCLPSTGSAMEDGEVTICHYNTDSLELAYETIVKMSASQEDFGYTLLRKTLPSTDLEDNFDDKQTWIRYVWADKTHIRVTIQMAGGEDTLIFAKEKNSVKVTTTLSAD